MQQVFDAHVDTLMRIGDPEQFLKGTRRTHLDMPRAIEAGVSHLVTAVCSEAEKDPLKAFHNGYSNYLQLRHRSSITLHLMLEGCQQLCELPEREEIIRDAAVASLTWNGRNSLGGGIGTDTGLTDPGRSLALELHDEGVLLDVSHLCDRSRGELLSLGICTVATHCNCRALHDFPRNLPDDDLRRIAASGGVVGITFVPAFLGGGEALEDIVRHLEHLVDAAGIDAAGFGSDFDGVGRLPGGVPDCTVWPSLFELLDRRGWSAEDIDLVAFGNWRRVIK